MKNEAYNKGLKELDEFKKYFPEGKDYEFYDVSFKQKVCIARVPTEGIHYIALNFFEMVHAFFSEIDLEIDPEYSLVYHHKKGYFIFVPVLPFQKDAINRLHEDFYRAWLNDEKSKFNPKKAIFNPQNFVANSKYQRAIKYCLKLYNKTIDILIKKKPPKPMEILDPILEDMNKKFSKSLPDLKFQDKFKVNFNKLLTFNKSIRLLNAVRGSKTSPSGGQRAASYLTLAPAASLKIPSIYLFPNRNRTNIIILVPHSGYSRKTFEHYRAVYMTIKEIYNSLIDL